MFRTPCQVQQILEPIFGCVFASTATGISVLEYCLLDYCLIDTEQVVMKYVVIILVIVVAVEVACNVTTLQKASHHHSRPVPGSCHHFGQKRDRLAIYLPSSMTKMER